LERHELLINLLNVKEKTLSDSELTL